MKSHDISGLADELLDRYGPDTLGIVLPQVVALLSAPDICSFNCPRSVPAALYSEWFRFAHEIAAGGETLKAGR